MPAPIVCPHCHEHLEIPAEYHGRQVRCANCQNTFVVTTDDAPVVQPLPRRSAEDDRPPWRDDRGSRRPRRDEEDDDRPARRSNAGVLGLLFLTALTIGVCCGGLNLLMLVHANPTITTFTSPEGKFKVDFPGEKPTGEPIAAEGDKVAEGGWQVAANRQNANERYTVRCYDLKPEWQKLDEYDALTKVADDELAILEATGRVKDKGARTDQTTHAGFTALDVMAGKGKGLTQQAIIMRCVLAGKRVYVVSAQGAQNFHQFWWVRQFFLSFEITDPTAKPPKRDDEPKKEKKQD